MLSSVRVGLAQERWSSAHRREVALWASLLAYQPLESVARRERILSLKNAVTELYWVLVMRLSDVGSR